MKPPLLTLATLALSATSPAALVGLWEFDNAANLGEATLGGDLVLQNGNGTIAATGGVGGGDGAAQVGVGDHFDAAPGIAANGGGSFVNEFTIVFDVFLPTSTDGTWRSLLQTANNNGNDGDYFVSNSNQVGVGAIGYTGATVGADDWYRIVFSADLGSGAFGGGDFLTTVTDSSGTSFSFNHGTQGIDGRHSLYALDNGNIVKLFADENGEDNLVYVSAVGIYDAPLTEAQALALGAPGTAIPEPTAALLAAFGALAILRRRRG